MTNNTHCPICQCDDALLLEHRAGVPVMMHRLYETAEDAKSCKRATLTMQRCGTCGFSWNSAFDPAAVDYDDLYENAQTHSPVFTRHVEDRARDLIAAVPEGSEFDFLEVGCGQGGFLDLVAELAGVRLRTAVGFDPSFRGPDKTKRGKAIIHKAYFSAASSDRLEHAPNIVASRHTIEHVPDPVAFLQAIRHALGPDSRARLFVETPCIDWIIAHRAMHDLFYEHCSIFTAHSLKLALERAGFARVQTQHVFGGQYLWASGEAAPVEMREGPAALLSPYVDATVSTQHYTDHWRNELSLASAEGPVAVWGAGAKGVTFAFLLDPDGQLFDSVIDINPAKQGRYLAGSGLEILAPEGAAARRPRTVFVMNPNYLDEIRVIAAKAGLDAALVPIN